MGGMGSGNVTRRVNHDRVVALLHEECMSMSEIAERVGCSRERVRQLALKYLNVTGRERQDSCPLRIPQLPDSNFVSDAEEVGLAVSIAFTPSGASRSELMVNDFRCRLCTAWDRSSHVRSGVTIQPVGGSDADFQIFELPDGRWLIVPQQALPPKSTMFTINEPARQKGYSMRHDWRTYINAWHLLGGNVQILDPVTKEETIRGSAKWKGVLEKLGTLPEGMALPVVLDTNQDAMALQSFLFGRQNAKSFSGHRYECKRSKSTLYISRAVNGNGHGQ